MRPYGFIFIIITILLSCKDNKLQKVESFLTDNDYMFWEAKKYDEYWDRGWRLYYYFDKNGTFLYMSRGVDGNYRLSGNIDDVFYEEKYKIISDSVISTFGTNLSWIEIDYVNKEFKLYDHTKSEYKIFFQPSEKILSELKKFKEEKGF